MKNYNFKRRSFSSGPHFLGLLLMLVGLFSIVSPAFIQSPNSLEKSILVGMGAIALGLMVFSTYNGTIIDFDNMRLKEYTSFMGYKFGQWSVLPKITRIAIASANHKATNTPNGISPTWSGTVNNYKVFLYSESSTALLSFTFSNKERAIADAKLMSASLSVTCEMRIEEEV